MKVLFFSQDPDRVEQLALALRLRWPDLTPQVVSQGRLGLEVIEKEAPEILIISEDLPDMSVFSAIQEIRRFSDIPIMVIVESDGEMDLVKALELGADDYIRLPCNLMEVMARAVTTLRRSGMSRDGGATGPHTLR